MTRGLHYFLFLLLVCLVSCSSDSNTKRYDLITTATPTDGGTITPSSGEYEDGEVVELSASSNENWVFNGWQGDLSGDTNPQSITMDSDKSVAALFVKRDYPLTITIQGPGSVTEQIIQQKATDYPHGTVVELKAEPAEGAEFEGWQGDIETTENPATVTIEKETEITAVFSGVEYPLEVTVEGQGTVTEEVIQSKTDYPEGTLVELTAEAADNWIFSMWSGDLEGDENPSQLTVDSPKEVTATFLRTYNLTTNADPEEGGSITPDDGQYIRDTTLEVEAVPASNGWRFVEWEGDFSGSVNPFDLTMNGDKTITATFERKEFELKTTIDGEGEIARTLLSGEETKEDTYQFESEVRLTAIADDGWNFLRWEGDASGDDSTIEIGMDEDKEITAVFIEFEGGDGSESDPYQVATLDQLDKVRNYLDSHFIQIADIDASSTQAKSNGEGWVPIGEWIDEENNEPFTGSYNGDGFEIQSLYIGANHDYEGVFGLFGYTKNSILENIILKDILFVNENYSESGGIVGVNDGLIQNVRVNGTIEYSGGGVAGINNGQIMDSYSDVEGFYEYGGGLVFTNYGEIMRSQAHGELDSFSTAGGLVGRNFGLIEESFATGNVSAVGSNGSSAGGLVAGNSGKIVKSYATGFAFGEARGGGLVGFNGTDGEVFESYAAVVLSAKRKVDECFSGNCSGGFIAQNEGEVTSGYWDSEAGDDDYMSYGSSVDVGSTEGITELTTSEMTGSNAQDNMPDFNWVDTWRLTSGYPILYWQEE